MHVIVWFGLRVCSFGTLQKLLSRFAPPATATHGPRRAAEARIVWAMSVTRRYLPLARNCLVRALVAQALFGRRGHPVSLRIGVDSTRGRRLQAHAWVESEGRVIVGAPGAERFTPLSRPGQEQR